MMALRLAVGFAALMGLAHAQPPDPLQVRSWAASCAGCHGSGGPAQRGIEPLAGRDRQEILDKVLDFRDRGKDATVMHHIARGYSGEQLAAIAAWFAAQKN